MVYIEAGEMDRISIVIRCKNEEKFIEKTLDSVFSQEIDIPFEVVVIDSGSSDRTPEIVRQYDVKLFEIPSESFTYGYALNYGIERATGHVICSLSAHCIPVSTTWLSELVSPIIEGRSHATFGRQVAIKGVNAFEEVALNKHFPEHGVIEGRIPFSNSNCAFLKEMWFVRKFDEEISSWEDYLWYLLLKDRYSFQYSPKAAVYHTHAFSIKAIARRAYNDGRAFKFIKKKYNIDLLKDVCLKTKFRIFVEDIKHHVRLFKGAGYTRQILLIPIVRFFAYKAYWDGYKSIK
ncbi:MAG: glycosyltransferase [Thermodesulfovibrionales bacterium]